MTCVLIEDEYNAYAYLSKILKDLRPDITVLAHLESVEEAVNWLNTNPHPNLVFMDIQLSDGRSFEIFNHIQINAPIIFTTAYDQYAIDAFKYNSLDYLLKPIVKEDLNQALHKFEQQQFAFNVNINQQLQSIFNQEVESKRNRCLVKKGKHFEYISVKDIAIIHSEDGITFLYTFEGERFVYNKSIESLALSLDSKVFFQISRSQIINIHAIHRMHPHLNNRLKLDINVKQIDLEIFVNRSKIKAFKAWVDN